MIYKERKLRHELKYKISRLQYEILKQRFNAVLTPDENSLNGGYRITSLYFDDIYQSGYNDKLLGEETRKKYRIRAYNLDPSFIKLECKHKDNDYISKRNTNLTHKEYQMLYQGDLEFAKDKKYSGTSLESFYISNSLARLKPSVVVDYYREAFVSPLGNIRFTFDSKISTSYNSLDLFSPDAVFSQVLDETVLELKFDDFMPSYLHDIIQGVGLQRESVSKFVICKEAMMTYHKPGVYY